MEIQTAIITGICTILASIITLILNEYYAKQKGNYQKIENRIREIVYGRWKGNFEQTYNGQIRRFDIFLELKVDSNGKITGKAKIPLDNETLEFSITGGFYSERFLKMDYENLDNAIVQFGSFVLKLSDNAKKLDGCFVGYSQQSGKIISGNTVFDKI